MMFKNWVKQQLKRNDGTRYDWGSEFKDWVKQQLKRNNGMRYDWGSGVPRQIPAGRVMCHNFPPPAKDTPIGVNGFRCFTFPEQKLPSNFHPCDCGYAGLPHYTSR
jgi:hypothetical protein